MAYDRKIGRFRVEVGRDGAEQHDYRHGVSIEYHDGFNDSCETKTFYCSVEELHDLHYLLGRAIVAAERK